MTAGAAQPALSVVVPSHDRPLRLRWLLNALEEQTLDRSEWELVVAHDSSGPETEELLRSHPLAAAGVLRHLTFTPGPGPAAKRNAAWGEARAPTVVFTDDDCRPPVDWLERVLAAARRHPDAIVQGTTQVDPDELAIKLHAPFARSQEVVPPVPWAQTCNIVYPRHVLEATGGFDESLPLAAGEDTDLAFRAREQGVEYVAAAEVVTYHAVEAVTLPARLRELWRWQHLAFIPQRHPQVREHMAGGGWFWKPTHVRLPLAAAGLLTLARGRPLLAAAMIAPWAQISMPSYGSSWRGRLRAVAELPSHAAIDAVEFAAMVRGSIRYRTLIL
jgi:GT2 family glycosyltransferase